MCLLCALLQRPHETTSALTGTHDLDAGASAGWTGGPRPRTGEAGPPPIVPLARLADYLIDGYWRETGQAPRALDLSGDRVVTVDLSALSPAGRRLALDALAAWSSVADLEFRQVRGAVQITFTEDGYGAYSQSEVTGGRILSSTVNVDRDWLREDGGGIGSYSFQVYLHEIGHALGLGHLGRYNGDGDSTAGVRFGNDSWQASVMSYFGQDEIAHPTASLALAVTPMPADILAIQRLYGAAGPGSLTDGDTTYGVGHTLGDSWLGRLFSAQDGMRVPGVQEARAVAITLHDAGGWDRLDLSNDAWDQRVDLRPGAASDIYGLVGNLQISGSTLIEAYVAGTGHDTVTGNAADNTLRGGAGHDRLIGLTGDDRLVGGAGDDTLLGGAGTDSLFGGMGHDLLRDAWGDTRMSGGGGHDILTAGTGQDTLLGDRGDDLLRAGAGRDLLRGGEGHDTIWAGAGDDHADGGAGDDHLWGGTGQDTLSGGPGADRLSGGAGRDVLAGGSGRDRLEGGLDHDLLRGQDGADRLWGQAGRDTLVGGAGPDTLSGGSGADTFRFLALSDSSILMPDLILDFQVGLDVLDLQALDLSWRAEGTAAGAGSLRWDHVGAETQVFADPQDDGSPDMRIRLAGTLDLQADSFLL